MRKFVLSGVAIAMLIGVPALAIGSADKPGHAGVSMTRAELETKVRDMFARADANRDGSVSKAEFAAAREARKAERGAKRSERRGERFARMDSDRNGQISRAEFDAAHAGRAAKVADAGGQGRHGGWRGHHHGQGMMGAGMGERWFDRADADKNGAVTYAEASARPLQMFDRADANKDGTVSPEEHDAARKAFREGWKAKRG